MEQTGEGSVAVEDATDGTFEVAVVRLDTDSAAVRESAALLSDVEQRRATQFAFASDRRRFIVARAGLRQLLAARLGVRPESVELVCGAHGKPTLARHATEADVRFNVSHCGDLAVYALSSGREIGIDVEAVRVIPEADDIASRFFSSREQAAYAVLDARRRPLGFFNCWTRKEAFVKALGDGLTHPLHDFDVSLSPDEPARILRVARTSGAQCGWRIESFSPAPGFVAAVVIEGRKAVA